MANNYDRPAERIVIGSGVAGPMILVTSGQRVARSSAMTTWTIQWNMNGTAGNGRVFEPMGQITPNGTRVPLIGGSPTGTVTIEGSNDDNYYVDLGVTVSSLFASSSGIRLISLAGPMPDYQRLKYTNVASSGVFDVTFGSRGY